MAPRLIFIIGRTAAQGLPIVEDPVKDCSVCCVNTEPLEPLINARPICLSMLPRIPISI
jgi:hypothetical protein